YGTTCAACNFSCRDALAPECLSRRHPSQQLSFPRCHQWSLLESRRPLTRACDFLTDGGGPGSYPSWKGHPAIGPAAIVRCKAGSTVSVRARALCREAVSSAPVLVPSHLSLDPKIDPNRDEHRRSKLNTRPDTSA